MPKKKLSPPFFTLPFKKRNSLRCLKNKSKYRAKMFKNDRWLKKDKNHAVILTVVLPVVKGCKFMPKKYVNYYLKPVN